MGVVRAGVAQAALPITCTTLENSDALLPAAVAVAFTRAPLARAARPVSDQVPPLCTVVVMPCAVPSTYTVLTVPTASLDVPLTTVALVRMGALTTGAAVRAGMVLPDVVGTAAPLVGVAPVTNST